MWFLFWTSRKGKAVEEPLTFRRDGLTRSPYAALVAAVGGPGSAWSAGPDRFPSAAVYRGVPARQRVSVMAKRLYVGNLSYSVTSDQLQELFEQYGQVRSAQVLSDRETGRSRGFGFVEMDVDSEAESAIESLDGQEFGGRRLTVNEAKPRTPGGGGGGYGGGGGGRRGGGGYGGGGYGGNY